ncbi:hypothetical protein RB195_008601 [Necator americanus]|uniref:Uncharacterized protein n=1 Tax=Necator americanus TaxID=51031 RepID=A0ABR1CPE8_NECAM
MNLAAAVQPRQRSTRSTAHWRRAPRPPGPGLPLVPFASQEETRSPKTFPVFRQEGVTMAAAAKGENRYAKHSPLKNSMSLFKYGCCVPTNTVLWLIIVLTIFAVIGLIFCFMSMVFTRWMYKRRIRNKTETLKRRYEEEYQSRREKEFRMKELAMRPVHGHHHHQREPVEEPEVVPKQIAAEQIKSCTAKDVDIAQHQKFLSNITHNTAYFNLPDQRDSPQKNLLFTGTTPLKSESGPPMPPCFFTGTTPLQSTQSDILMPSTGGTSYLTAGTKPTSTSTSFPTSTGAFARSFSTTVPSEGDANVPVEPFDVAATAHAIVVGANRDIEIRQPFPGVILLNKDQRPLGQCPSERILLIPTRSDSMVALGMKPSPESGKSASTATNEENSPSMAKHATAHGYVLASLINELTESDSTKKASVEGKKRTDFESVSKKPKSPGEVDVHLPTALPAYKEQPKTEMKRKRKALKCKPLEKEKFPPKGGIPESPASSSTRGFFPYWTGRRRVFSKVEPTISSSGKTQAAKMVSSEVNIWEPSRKASVESLRRRASESSNTSTPGKKEPARPVSTPQRPPVLDVYELRRQMERMNAERIRRAEIAKMAAEENKNSSDDEKWSPKGKELHKLSTIQEGRVTRV